MRWLPRPIANMLLALLLMPLHMLAQNPAQIRFAKGAVSGAVRGEVSTTIKTYPFRAQKRQNVVAVLEPAGGDRGMLTMTRR